MQAATADDRVLREAATGDEIAFRGLIDPHLEPGFRLAVAMLQNPDEAEDAIQEAVLAAWRAIGRLRPESNVRAWFMTIVANRCRSMRRRRWWGVIRQADPPERPDCTDPIDGIPDLIDLRRRLRALDADDRAILVLRYYEDLSLGEVASTLGISTTAARSRIHRALKRLRPGLEEAIRS